MGTTDHDLLSLAENGLPPLPTAEQSGLVRTDGADIWYAAYGAGPAVVLLHGGLGNSGNFAHQIPALVAAGYQVIAIDSRGQGRSTRDARPYSYQLLAADTRAVLDRLGVSRAAYVGWSDGAATSLVLARETPERAAGVFFFACNVDPSGTLPFEPTPIIDRIYAYHVAQYAALSPLPGQFEAMRDDLDAMQASQPNYGPTDLGAISVPVWGVLGDGDEFIRREHIEYIVRSIPGAAFHLLRNVSHFAPIQDPAQFNAAVLRFLSEAWPPPHHRN